MANKDKPDVAAILAKIQANKAAREKTVVPEQPTIQEQPERKADTKQTVAVASTPHKPTKSAAQLLAEMRAAKKLQAAPLPSTKVSQPPPEPEREQQQEVQTSINIPELKLDKTEVTGMHGELITYNERQQLFVDTVAQGKSCVLIGAAGTGKTTATQGAIQALITNNIAGTLDAAGHGHLTNGTPGIIIISFTRRAVNNIRKVQSKEIANNCITAHKLLEYQPVYYEKLTEDGDLKKTMCFEPSRNQNNLLPSSINVIVVEEASMLGLDIYTKITEALGHDVIWIFIGDIQQLPPVFGPAILGFKMLELPVIELTEVYRQALESPIIRLAHRILSGKPIPADEFPEWKVPGQLTIHPWKKKITEDAAILTLAGFFKGALDKGLYTPETDCILMPFNKGVGTLELNKHIANHLAKKRQAMTYEVQAGFNKYYLSVGDRVLCDKEDAVIRDIKVNRAYTGSKVQPPSVNLDYWGYNPKISEEAPHFADYSNEDVDLLLDAVASDSEDRVNQASHIITVYLEEAERELELKTAADINNLLHGYAITVHKSQGSEWAKVFIILHHTHATMLQRELLYTAVTRARKELYIICEPDSLVKGVKRQKIKGNTIAEKAEIFKGKLEQLDKVSQLLERTKG